MIVLPALLTLLCAAFQVSLCIHDVQSPELASQTELVWSLQMGKFGFSGFMNEFLGVAPDMLAIFPRMRLAHAYFGQSFNETALSGDFLSQLFSKERDAVEALYSSDAKSSKDIIEVTSERYPQCIYEVDSFDIDAAVLKLGNMWRPHIFNATSPSHCCAICSEDSRCIGWSAYRDYRAEGKYLCELKGSRTLAEAVVDAHIQKGELVAAASLKRSVAPRVKLFHGTTCAFQNSSLQKPSIDEIRVGRYMVERDIASSGLETEEMSMLRCAVYMDEIWVPTEWNKDLFMRYFASIGFNDKSVQVIPEAVDTSLFDRRAINGLEELTPWSGNSYCPDVGDASRHETFKFLSIFKWEYRKGWDILLKAYWQTFSPLDRVLLRLHTYLPTWRLGVSNISYVIEQQAMVLFGKRLEELAPIEWIESPFTESSVTGDSNTIAPATFSRPQLAALIASADAFVLPTRGEGWGLPVVEAMSMEVPVIVSNHSGPAIFATDDNAYLIPMLPGVDRRGYAKPDGEALARLMKQVVIDSCPSSTGGGPTIARLKAMRARRDLEKWSPKNVVRAIQERIVALVSERKKLSMP